MPNTPFSANKFRYIFAGGWLLWVCLHVKVLHWYNFPLKAAITDSIVTNILLALCCMLLSTMFKFYLPTRDRYGYLLSLSVALTLLWFFISRSILIIVQKNVSDYNHFFALSVPVRLAIGYLVNGSMILLFVLWYTLSEQRDNERRKTEAERLAREAELFNLRQQLQPHFLFNSLNSINALIGFKPDRARKMIQQLSDFLRNTLNQDNQQFSTLADELAQLQLYLDIEMVRFGHRLKTKINYPEACAVMKLPGLILQPVVENAIKFGLYDTIGEVTISIDVFKKGNQLQIQVVNPFEQSSSLQKKGTGFGLNSVQRRLYLVYAQHGLLQTAINENNFITTLTIPQVND